MVVGESLPLFWVVDLVVVSAAVVVVLVVVLTPVFETIGTRVGIVEVKVVLSDVMVDVRVELTLRSEVTPVDTDYS